MVKLYMDLEDKVAIVTGSSRGIGRSIALRLGEEGCRVVVNYRRNKDLAVETVKAIEEAGGYAIAVKGDVSNYKDCMYIIDETRAQFGGIDILVNNAGIFFAKPFIELDPQDWEYMFRVNVFGMFNMTRCALPHMIEKGQGVIINISSIASSIRNSRCIPHPGRVAYAASKSAVNGFTLSLASELARYNIRVNGVAPGLTDTDMVRNVPNLPERAKKVPLGRIGRPEEIAEAVLFLIRNDYITGEIIVVSGGD